MADTRLDFTDENVAVDGMDSLVARLSVLPGNSMETALRAMLEICEEKVMPDIKENRVPFRLGNLRSSGAVSRDGDVIVLEFGTPGSGAEEYAVVQHETLSFNHLIGEAKYLENGLDDWAERIIEAAGQSIKNMLEILSGQTVVVRMVSEHSLKDELAHVGGVHGKSEPPSKPAPKKAPPRLVKKHKA